MKKTNLFTLALFSSIVTLQSCELVEGIFKAGMWWAFILIAIVVGLVIWLLGRGRRG